MSLLGKQFWNTIGQDKKILNLTPKDDLPKWLEIKDGGIVNCQYRAEILGTGGEIYNIYRIKMNYDEKATFKHLIPYAESTGYFDMMWFMIDKDSPGATVDIHGFPESNESWDDGLKLITGQLHVDYQKVPEEGGFYCPKVLYDVIPLPATFLSHHRHADVIMNLYNNSATQKEIEIMLTVGK